MRSVASSLGLAILAVLAAGFWPAQAQTTAGKAAPADKIVQPSWLAKPSSYETASFYPESATDRSVSGQATIRCRVRVDTRVDNCEIVSEGPYGMGFGDAGVKLLTKSARLKPRTVNGKADDQGIVVIPVQFMSPKPGARYVIYQPIWAATPSFEDMAAAWPPSAGTTVSRTAVLRCSLLDTGRLRDCIVAADASPSDDFGAAAKRLASKFQMRLTPDEANRYATSDVLMAVTFLNPATPEGRTASESEPRWITSIKPEKILEVYPPQAAEAGIKSGRGVADCLVAADGKLTDCKVAREKPGGLGFGASAVAIAQLMQMNPWTDKGRPVAGARIKLPVDFSLAPEAEAGQ